MRSTMIQTTVARGLSTPVSGGEMPTSLEPWYTADTPRDPEDLPEAVAEGVAQFLGRPRLRGWIHVYSAVIAVICGATLVAVSWSVQSTQAGVATLVYTLTIVAMFTVSGTYH